MRVDWRTDGTGDRQGWSHKHELVDAIVGAVLGQPFKIKDLTDQHASMDNQTDQIRLSTDTRYQLASEPVDERWIGDNPIAHGLESKRGMIC